MYKYFSKVLKSNIFALIFSFLFFLLFQNLLYYSQYCNTFYLNKHTMLIENK